MVIKAILEYAGLQVDIVANGKEAIEVVSSLPYDILLMDISMPEMDGIAATKAIRKLPGQVSKMPIVALTAHALSGDKERFLKAGMDDYLIKPIDRSAILHCIAQWTPHENRNLPPSNTTIQPQESQVKTVSGELVDELVLQQLVKDTAPDVVPTLLTLYIDDAQKRLELISNAIEKFDIKTLEFETHSLGSSAAAHGNLKLHNQARHVEHLCQEENQNQALTEASRLTAIAVESLRLLAERSEVGFG